MTGPQIFGAMQAASLIKKFTPAVPVIWGGVHPSLTPEETIKSELVDIIVIGDGEETFKELVETIHCGRDKKSVKRSNITPTIQFTGRFATVAMPLLYAPVRKTLIRCKKTTATIKCAAILCKPRKNQQKVITNSISLTLQ